MTTRRTPSHYQLAGRVMTAAQASCFCALATAPGPVTIFQVARVSGRTVRTVSRFLALKKHLVTFTQTDQGPKWWSLSPLGRLMVEDLWTDRAEAAE